MRAEVYSGGVGRKPNPPPNERAAWVRDVREKIARANQDKFAHELQVARPTVTNWERGKYIPEWASIEKILKRYPSAPQPPFGPTRDEVLHNKLEGMTDEGLEVAEFVNPLPEALRKELRDQFYRLVQLRLARGEREAK